MKELSEAAKEHRLLVALGDALTASVDALKQGKNVEEATQETFKKLIETQNTAEFISFVSKGAREDGMKKGFWKGYVVGIGVSIIVFGLLVWLKP